MLATFFGVRRHTDELYPSLALRRLPGHCAATPRLLVGFEDLSDTNPAKFDGPGGQLAEADSTHLTFDGAERWLLQVRYWSCLACLGSFKHAPDIRKIASCLR